MNKQVNLKMKKARARRGMTQAEVALAIKISRSDYSKIENGHRDLKISLACKISEFFGKSLDELFG
ncbi:helix-turn-helix transcriptional regulator [Priestia aryabhattai]|uniref:Helix-turn-helix transcriptional regulator n=1 Tax=Priestia aryabhattai TaxID=412384 RepID=A0ABD7X415_PRIAR|nr:helix-turn-helix transcriptional regulator [Priestia aryabhattai]WEA47313.1 helix-turn-helix transcriptional regulator [Priestia aryabhattai]